MILSSLIFFSHQCLSKHAFTLSLVVCGGLFIAIVSLFWMSWCYSFLLETTLEDLISPLVPFQSHFRLFVLTPKNSCQDIEKSKSYTQILLCGMVKYLLFCQHYFISTGPINRAHDLDLLYLPFQAD